MSKIQVRKGLFETNSSSVHTLVMCDESDFDKWKNGELVYDYMNCELVPTTDDKYVEWSKMTDEEKEDSFSLYDYLTYDDFFENWEAIDYERFEQSYKTEKGETVIAFGYYGHD